MYVLIAYDLWYVSSVSCMHVCCCVCVYVYYTHHMHPCIHTCIHVSMSACLRLHLHAYVCGWMYDSDGLLSPEWRRHGTSVDAFRVWKRHYASDLNNARAKLLEIDQVQVTPRHPNECWLLQGTPTSVGYPKAPQRVLAPTEVLSPTSVGTKKCRHRTSGCVIYRPGGATGIVGCTADSVGDGD